jgi:hypothetical protein|tara:strand:+ start:55 stop:294 length:240 start_codon:yes stop_codon:yes gene_type:complete
MDNVKTNKKRGRPVVGLSWPTTVFTVKDVMEGEKNPPTSLTSASVRMKVREALEAGTLVRVGMEKGKTGRPRSMFMKTD